MVLRAERPIVRVEHSSMRTIETRDTENLFGLWSVFARCSPAMEDGKRYENMAWRLWSRETFCCQPDPVVPPQWAFERQLSTSATDMPELSSSVASDDSSPESALTTASRSDLSASRPDLRRHDSATSQARGKHLTPIGLEKVVNSIQEKKFIEPLSPLPPQLAAPLAQPKLSKDTTPRAASPPCTARPVPESSTSTVATTLGSDAMSPAVSSEASTSTDMSQHSVVRGFEPGHMSTSVRSSTNLNPTPILKNTSSFVAKPLPSKAEPMKKKQPMFTLGGSSDEDNSSSFEAYSLQQRSSLTEHLRRAAPMRKTTSFKNEVSTRTIPDITSESEGAIESDSEEEFDESAIDEDDSEEEWEDDDENEESGPSSVNERPLFPRVDSKPDLTSRRSLLTTALHEGDRALALQNAASRSTPAIRRSRTTTPNGPSTGNSPQEDTGLMMRPQATRAKPIIMTTSNVHPPAMSPKTTRRLMLQSELTGSLRQNLLWERQQKNATTNAVAKRQQSAVSLPALRRAMTTGDVKGLNTNPQQAQIRSTTFRDNNKNNSSYNDYFDQGLQAYHTSGW
ncbi:Nn.00g061080.m01.CDS01 [Neocucurbitaria sp. VM-36]